MSSIPRPIYIYHITHLDNLPSILAHGGMLCCAALQQHTVGYTNIAYGHIQDRRALTPVQCGPGGTLHDYVPFYFAPRSPMLYTINRGNVPGYTGGQRSILHLVSTIEAVQNAGLQFVFADGHATMRLTDIHDDLAMLDRIDWDVMSSTYWHNTVEDGDRRRRRQAGFLVHQFFPLSALTSIGVHDKAIEAQVLQMLQSSVSKPVVACQPRWYY